MRLELGKNFSLQKMEGMPPWWRGPWLPMHVTVIKSTIKMIDSFHNSLINGIRSNG